MCYKDWEERRKRAGYILMRGIPNYETDIVLISELDRLANVVGALHGHRVLHVAPNFARRLARGEGIAAGVCEERGLDGMGRFNTIRIL